MISWRYGGGMGLFGPAQLGDGVALAQSWQQTFFMLLIIGAGFATVGLLLRDTTGKAPTLVIASLSNPASGPRRSNSSSGRSVA